MKHEPSRNVPYAQPLRPLLSGAQHSVNCFVTAPLPVDGQRALLHCAAAGVAVDLVVPASYLHKVGLTDRYRQKFTAAGGRFFVVNLRPADWRRIRLLPRNLLLIDEQTSWQPTGTAGLWRSLPGKQADVLTQFQQLRETGTMPIGPPSPPPPVTGWRAGPAALHVTFVAASQRVRPGERAGLQWSAPEATSVEILPRPGRVPATGSTSVWINEPTEFILTAHRGAEAVAKVLTVQLDLSVGLDFYLTATAPPNQGAPARLKSRPELPDYFGVLQGTTLTLHWHTTNAAAVRLAGEPVATSGNHTFLPQAKTTLRLLADGVQGDRAERRIVVNTFRAPLRLPSATSLPPLGAPSPPTLPEIPAVLGSLTPPADPLAGLDATTRNLLEEQWRARNRHGWAGSLRNWFKKISR